MKDLFGDLARHNIAVIPIGNCGKDSGLFNASSTQHFFIDAVAHHCFATKTALQSLERLSAVVNYDHIMAAVIQHGCQGRAHAPTAENDDLHHCPPLMNVECIQSLVCCW